MSYGKNGAFTLAPNRKSDPLQRRTAKHFGMMAGGTGITPMLQVLHAVLRDEPDSPITCSLLYCNQTEDDILVRAELEGLVQQFPTRFKLHYTVDKAPEGWKYSTGCITQAMVEEHLPKAAPDGSTQVLVCGPPPMVKFACLPHLEALGFRKEDYFVF
jgi:cytochrome-b5 reductase